MQRSQRAVARVGTLLRRYEATAQRRYDVVSVDEAQRSRWASCGVTVRPPHQHRQQSSLVGGSCSGPGRGSGRAHQFEQRRFCAGKAARPKDVGSSFSHTSGDQNCAAEKADGTTNPTNSATAGSSSPGMDRAMMRDVAILSGSQFMLNLGFSQMVPVMPLFAAQMGAHLGATGVGMVIAAPSAAMLVLNVPLGRLCDTVGRKPLMYWGTALTSIGSVLTGFSGSLATLLPCRLLVGSGICSSMTGSSAYMADLTDRAPEHRAKIMGINSMVSGSIWVVGPAAGGWLAENYGYQNSFLIAGVGSALCSLGYTQLPETLKLKPAAKAASKESMTIREHVRHWMDDVGPLLSSGNQQGLIAMSLVPSMRWSCFTTVVALHATAVTGAGAAEIGLMFTSLALSQGIGVPLGSYLADKTIGARAKIVLPAGLLSCASFASIGFATDLNHFLAAMAVQGLCAGFTLPAQGAFRAEVTPQALRGQAMSLERQAGSVVSLLGPVSWGLLADLTSCPTAIWLASGLMAGCHVLYLLRTRLTRHAL